MAERINLPAGAARAIALELGERVRIVNVEGHQVVDTWAFAADDLAEHLSMEHSRSATYRILFKPGDTLVTNQFRPILTITDDTSPGIHDTLHAACSAPSNVFYGAPNTHPNCEDNLKAAMAVRGVALDHVPCPWNLFEHAPVAPDGSLSDEPSAAEPGDYVELQAEMDIVLICSACPSTVGDISAGPPRGAAIDCLGRPDSEPT
ncbi:MAG: urea carboxylase-associated family protein [Pseudomonadota bacterium]